MMSQYTSQQPVFLQNMISFMLNPDNWPDGIPKLTNFNPGSVIYTIFAAVATELDSCEYSNFVQKETLDIMSLSDTDLDKKASDYGITRKVAEAASNPFTFIKFTPAVSSMPISKGSVISTLPDSNGTVISFVTKEDGILASGQTQVDIDAVCTVSGSIGNLAANTSVFLSSPIIGIDSVKLTETITNGIDVESDDSLRKRLIERLQNPATSGNIYDYEKWAKEVNDVGDAKGFETWNGNGTVKVVIVNSNKRAADNNLVTAVYNYIEENRPIGANVTVVSAVEKQLNISVTLVIDTKKYTLAQVQAALEANLSKYYAGIAFVNNYVSYASVGNIIFNTDGVIDLSNLLINNTSANIPLQSDEIPVLGTVSLGV